MNLNPFIDLIAAVLSLYNLALIIYIILYYLLMFNIVNRHSPVVTQISHFLNRLIEPVLQKIRNYIPVMGGVDLSVIALFLLVGFTKGALYTYFYAY
jgi:YggT family protein